MQSLRSSEIQAGRPKLISFLEETKTKFQKLKFTFTVIFLRMVNFHYECVCSPGGPTLFETFQLNNDAVKMMPFFMGPHNITFK